MRLPNLTRLRLAFAIAGALVTLSAACRLDMLLNNKKPPHAVLSVEPTAVRDSARAGSSDVRRAKIAITNSGTGGNEFAWSASDHADWIHLDPADGAVPDTLTIMLDPDGLDPGVYQGDVTVTAKDQAGSADSQFTTISVTFLVQRPGLNVAPATIEHAASVNSNATFTDNIQISNSGSGSLNWTAQEGEPWISLGAKSGSGNGTIPVTINTAGLPGGTYNGDITITAPGAEGSPAHVTVKLTILAPGLAVTPTAIRDSVPIGTLTPKTATLHITNSGNGTITWTATKSQPWLTLSKTTGAAPDDVVVTMSPLGLPAGVQRDTIVFTAPGATNGPVRIPVAFVITQPGLAVSPDSIGATAQQGDTKKQRFTLSITNSAGGTLTWSATDDQPWIAVTPAAGAAPSTLSVDVDPTGMAAGTHSGTVTVSSPGAAGSPFKVPVQLTITSKPCTATPLTLDAINKTGTLDANDCYAPHRPGSLANVYSFSANAGDTISMRMTGQFDAYLILSDYSGNVLAENDDCPGESGPSCITDYPITAGGQYYIEATSAAPGATGQMALTVVRERPPTAPQSLGQFRANGTTTIPVGDTIPETEVVFRGKVNDPNLNETVRLEIELEPLGSPFTGEATQVGDYVPAASTSTLTSVQATGLTNKTGYRWQARSCDNTGRCSAWLPFGNNADTAADFTVVTP